MEKIFIESQISEEEKSILNTMIFEDKESYKGYKIQPLEKEEILDYNWDTDEEEFIAEHKEDELYFFSDCKAWEQGQMLSLVAVRY